MITEDFREKDIITRIFLTKDAEPKGHPEIPEPRDIITFTPEEYEDQDLLFVKNIRKDLPIPSA